MSEAFDPYHKWLGIPPAEQPPNHYRLLGVTLFESDPDVIAHAAEQRIVHVRAFQIGKHSDESQQILREISTARVCLLNADKKAEYDKQLRLAVAAPAPMSPVPAAAELTKIPIAVPVRAHHAPRKLKATWPLCLGGAAVAVAVVAFAIGLRSGGEKEAVQTAANPPAVEPTTTDASMPSAEPSVGDTERSGPVETPPSQAEQPAGQEASAPNPADQPQPKELAQEPKAVAEPSPSEMPKVLSEKEPAPPAAEPIPAANPEPALQQPPMPPENAPEKLPPTPPVAETAEQAEQRLNAALEQASTAAERQRIGQEALVFADKAILDSQAELASRLARLALRAARDSESPGLVTDATLLMSELATGISDGLRDKAKQRRGKQ